MKVRSAVLLAVMSLVAAAQRGATPVGRIPVGFPSGGSSLRCPFPNTGRPISPGRSPSWRWRNPITLWGAPVPWLGGSVCPSGFPADPFTGACNPAYYPPTPFDNSMSGMAMPDQPPLLPPPPLLPFPPMGNEPTAAQEPPYPPQVNSAAERQREASAGPGMQASQAPLPARAVPEEYPALIVLKPGGMYSVTTYWVKNNNLYFVTTQSEVLFAPLAQIDRVYPSSKARQ
jgi:hypothetical protein